MNGAIRMFRLLRQFPFFHAIMSNNENKELNLAYDSTANNLPFVQQLPYHKKVFSRYN